MTTRPIGTPQSQREASAGDALGVSEWRSPEPMPHGPATGTQVGPYVVIDTLGQGGMGRVYRAFDAKLSRQVALKVLRRDLESQEQTRLVREARVMAQLSHPNVVQVYEVGEHRGQTFVVMELVQGQTLRTWQRQPSRPSWRSCVRVYRQAGAGLAAAHEQELVHRDFKPSNVVIDDKGRARVLDFGLARTAADPSTDGQRNKNKITSSDSSRTTGRVAERLTQTGVVVGTLAYMPPEQMLGDPVDARGDQFSFCVSLYEALYGVRPFEGTTPK
ncbi:MAG: serine/threonine-protein kinase, partial [Myxococcota bacterium]